MLAWMLMLACMFTMSSALFVQQNVAAALRARMFAALTLSRTHTLLCQYCLFRDKADRIRCRVQLPFAYVHPLLISVIWLTNWVQQHLQMQMFITSVSAHRM